MSELGNKAEQAKGKLKEAAGDLTDDDDLRREGKVDHASGHGQGEGRRPQGQGRGAIDSVKDKVTGDRVDPIVGP